MKQQTQTNWDKIWDLPLFHLDTTFQPFLPAAICKTRMIAEFIWGPREKYNYQDVIAALLRRTVCCGLRRIGEVGLSALQCSGDGEWKSGRKNTREWKEAAYGLSHNSSHESDIGLINFLWCYNTHLSLQRTTDNPTDFESSSAVREPLSTTASVVSMITSSSLCECSWRIITPLSKTRSRTGNLSESSCLQAFTKSSGESNCNKVRHEKITRLFSFQNLFQFNSSLCLPGKVMLLCRWHNYTDEQIKILCRDGTVVSGRRSLQPRFPLQWKILTSIPLARFILQYTSVKVISPPHSLVEKTRMSEQQLFSSKNARRGLWFSIPPCWRRFKFTFNGVSVKELSCFASSLKYLSPVPCVSLVTGSAIPKLSKYDLKRTVYWIKEDLHSGYYDNGKLPVFFARSIIATCRSITGMIILNTRRTVILSSELFQLTSSSVISPFLSRILFVMSLDKFTISFAWKKKQNKWHLQTRPSQRKQALYVELWGVWCGKKVSSTLSMSFPRSSKATEMFLSTCLLFSWSFFSIPPIPVLTFLWKTELYQRSFFFVQKGHVQLCTETSTMDRNYTEMKHTWLVCGAAAAANSHRLFAKDSVRHRWSCNERQWIPTLTVSLWTTTAWRARLKKGSLTPCGFGGKKGCSFVVLSADRCRRPESIVK